MVKIITGRSIGGAVRYNENKVDNGKAELLDMHGFAIHNLSVKGKIGVFLERQKLNRRTKTNTVHISLNFSTKDSLDEGKLKSITSNYMKGIGFENQPYLLYQHLDAAHPHVHIVTTNIDQNGKRIETHNLGKFLSEKARRNIEESYGLIKAEEQKKEKINLIRPLEKATYGKQETKAILSNIVTEVNRTYRFTSLPELNAVLSQFNVVAFRGEIDSDMYRNRGLVYSVLNAEGVRIGVPIKASSIYGKPTLARLEKVFLKNKVVRKIYQKDLRESVWESLNQSKSLEDLEKCLRSKGIRPIFRINEDGRLYGVTYIDNVKRCVFNGSSLGKEFAANGLFAHFSNAIKGNKLDDEFQKKADSSKLQNLVISPDSFQSEAPTPYELRQKKKNKRKRLKRN